MMIDKTIKKTFDTPIPVRNYGFEPGTSINPQTIKGIPFFNKGARENVVCIEVVKEYDTYILLKVYTKVPVDNVLPGLPVKYYEHLESISKYALTVNDAFIEALEQQLQAKKEVLNHKGFFSFFCEL